MWFIFNNNMNINVFQIYTINDTDVSNNLNNHNLIYKNNLTNLEKL
jgi:hypothetical protein